jgi:GDP-L-fucose synthase
MKKDSRILVLGGTGLVGSALVRQLVTDGYQNILAPKRSELNLLDQQQTFQYFKTHQPEYVFLAAAKVGGIHANKTHPADFIFENLQIEINVFNAASTFVPRKLLFFGSSCIYPKNCPQPIQEEYLLTGELETTNEPYAIAKIAGLKLAENYKKQYGLPFFSVMPTNLYGPNDHFDPLNSHVIPGLITRMYQAKLNGDTEFKIWGSGKPRREFLHVYDLANACIYLMNYDSALPNYLNIGFGSDITIHALALLIKNEIGLEARLVFDESMPDGTMQKTLDSTKISNLGWKPIINLENGIKNTVQSFLKNHSR